MINVILTGGLGNVLFQYATGRHLAIKNNTNLRLILTHQMSRSDIFASRIVSELAAFKIEATFHRPILNKVLNFCSPGSSSEQNFVCEKHWGFDPDILLLKDGCYLKGLFQSERYFKDIESIIRRELQFKIPYLNDEISEISMLKDKIINSNSVFLHIRRGDYLNTKGLDVCNMEYYIKAVEYMKNRLEDPHFFVFSNDIEWCRTNLNIKKANFVNIEQAKAQPLIDFALMRLCKHGIIPNSTFSWWAAWLNDNPYKVVIAPNKWFSHDAVANAQALCDTIPENWVRIDI